MPREDPSRKDRPSEESENTKGTSVLKLKVLEAWRFTVASGALAGIVILLINIITLAVMSGRYETVNSSITFYTGPCHNAKAITISAHVVINILSTILLAYSSFSMQCLASPTRKEVDLAHSKRRWLSIGTPSIHNVFLVSKKKAALWLVLGVSSFPLHMIWNSTVFQTKNSYNYIAASVTENFLHDGHWDLPSHGAIFDDMGDDPIDIHDFGGAKYTDADFMHLLSHLQQKAVHDDLERLTVEDCIDEYYTEVITNRRHVLLVVDNSNADNNSVLAVYHNVNPVGNQDLYPVFEWMCDDTPAMNVADQCVSNRASWRPGVTAGNAGMFGRQVMAPVLYCYSQPATEHCKVDVIPAFLIAVVVCNIIKILSFVGALLITKMDRPLCTTGDAIQSFIKSPDPYTRGRCLAAKEDYEKWPFLSKEWDPRPSGIGDTWTGGRYHWGKAINTWGFSFFFVVIAGCIVATAIIFCATNSGAYNLSTVEGIGEAQSQSAQYGGATMGVLRGFILANVPQVIVSYLYLALNNMLTTMLAMSEWCGYATKSGVPQKGLRVSSPLPSTAQRSTYFLSVPYKWAIPCTTAIAALHWLVSEMQFFDRLTIYKLERQGPQEIATVGRIYSSSFAAIIAVGLASCLLIGFCLVSFVSRYPAKVPLSGCCSASIAAACQPSREYNGDTPKVDFDEDLSSQKLVWGVVEVPDNATNGNIGHATFAAAETARLEKDKSYA